MIESDRQPPDATQTVEYDTLTRSERLLPELEFAPEGDGERTFCPSSRGFTLSKDLSSDGIDVPSYEALVLEDGDWREASNEDVIGTDERVKISNTKVWPHRCVGKFRTTYPNGKTYIGSGVLVSQNCVLTCAHNVFNMGRGGWGNVVEFRPAQDGQGTPYGITAAAKLLAPAGYTTSSSRPSQFDYAVVVLSRSIGQEIGWWGYASESDQFFNAREFNVTGYPGDKGGREMWSCQGAIVPGLELLKYNIDTDDGQSGGPVWAQVGNDIVTYGVHITGTSGGNSGVRLTTARFNQIRGWIDANAPAERPSLDFLIEHALREKLRTMKPSLAA
jgi:V8-like Glu-specific endopeptidase